MINIIVLIPSQFHVRGAASRICIRDSCDLMCGGGAADDGLGMTKFAADLLNGMVYL